MGFQYGFLDGLWVVCGLGLWVAVDGWEGLWVVVVAGLWLRWVAEMVCVLLWWLCYELWWVVGLLFYFFSSPICVFEWLVEWW